MARKAIKGFKVPLTANPDKEIEIQDREPHRLSDEALLAEIVKIGQSYSEKTLDKSESQFLAQLRLIWSYVSKGHAQEHLVAQSLDILASLADKCGSKYHSHLCLLSRAYRGTLTENDNKSHQIVKGELHAKK